PQVDLVLVIGGRQSANTRHLWEIARGLKPSRLVHDLEDLDPSWFEGVKTVGLTAGASTPDYMIAEVEEAILQLAGSAAPPPATGSESLSEPVADR
ncbi:MAG: 4-hydroxy-3-methylbut-2-enyl diphosphate reductase, partial [Nitrospirota bacterium]|nr:4-hydroxy-3-methylbut-2-enyl diphosphate reductase [Nitrospirota bacterium]